MEKTFALKDALPELATNGKIAIYPTLDRKVVCVILIKDFEWPNRGKQEVSMCSFCRCFIFPGEKSKTKDGVKYHSTCPQRSNIGEITNKYLAKRVISAYLKKRQYNFLCGQIRQKLPLKMRIKQRIIKIKKWIRWPWFKKRRK